MAALPPTAGSPVMPPLGADAPATALARQAETPLNTPSPPSLLQDIARPAYVGLFLAGLTLGLGGSWAARFLFASAATKTAMATEAKRLMSTNTPPPSYEAVKVQDMALFNNALYSMFMLALTRPHFRGALLGYVGASMAGAVAGSLLQGAQEVWVRREETQIRKGLILRLQEVFRQSLLKKQTIDSELRATVTQDLHQALKRAGYDDAKIRQWLVEGKEATNGLAFEPVLGTFRPAFEREAAERLPATGPLFTGNGQAAPLTQHFGDKPPRSLLADEAASASPLAGWGHLAALGLGTLAGATLHQLGRFFRSVPGDQATARAGEFIVNTAPSDREAIFVFLSAFKERKTLLPALFLLLAGAQVGKKALDGLREIEVTRKHADIEYAYQRDNWLQLDPAYHRIAETMQAAQAVERLKQELPALGEAQTKARVDDILGKLGSGYWSAPAYFPMTVPVNLVPARM